MKYYSFEYWPYDNDGNINEGWLLVEMPREWAEEEIDKVVFYPYYDRPSLTWYLVEVEAENQVEAIRRAWNLILKADLKNIPVSTHEYYRITCAISTELLSIDECADKEIDWRITLPVDVDNLSQELNRVVNLEDPSLYVVEVKAHSIIDAFNHADVLFREYLGEDVL